MRVKKWETKLVRLTFRPRMKAGEGWIQEKNFEGDESQVEEDETADSGRKESREGVEGHGLDYLWW